MRAALAAGRLGPRTGRDLGRTDRVLRLDLPAHTSRDRVTPPSRRGGLYRWLHRALCHAGDLSRWAHARNPGDAGDSRARPQRRHLRGDHHPRSPRGLAMRLARVGSARRASEVMSSTSLPEAARSAERIAWCSRRSRLSMAAVSDLTMPQEDYVSGCSWASEGEHGSDSEPRFAQLTTATRGRQAESTIVQSRRTEVQCCELSLALLTGLSAITVGSPLRLGDDPRWSARSGWRGFIVTSTHRLLTPYPQCVEGSRELRIPLRDIRGRLERIHELRGGLLQILQHSTRVDHKL